MGIAARLDDIGKPAWITLMVLAFIAFWPAGLAVLAFLIGSGRMACWKRSRGRWHRGEQIGEQMREAAERWFGHRRDRHDRDGAPSSGNRAFDEYRSETLRRLEEEEREFREFLDRLRKAKDKEEFDQFMADRRARPSTGPEGGVPAV